METGHNVPTKCILPNCCVGRFLYVHLRQSFLLLSASLVWNVCSVGSIKYVLRCILCVCVSRVLEGVTVCFLYKIEHNMWTAIQEYLSWKVSVTSFNDKAADELFMLLLRVCVSACICVCVLGGVGGVAGVNNSEKKPFVFRGRRQRHIWNIWEEITLKAVSSKLMVTDANMSASCFFLLLACFCFLWELLHS